MDISEVIERLNRIALLDEIVEDVRQARAELDEMIERHIQQLQERDDEIERLHGVIRTYSRHYER